MLPSFEARPVIILDRMVLNLEMAVGTAHGSGLPTGKCGKVSSYSTDLTLLAHRANCIHSFVSI